MAVDLHRILCCKAPWPPHQHHQDLVHHLVPVINISVMDRMAGRSLQRLLFSFFLKDPVATATASWPLIRTMPMPEFPMAVAMAAMVSV